MSLHNYVSSLVLLLAFYVPIGCDRDKEKTTLPPPRVAPQSRPVARLLDARKSFQTHLVRKIASGEPIPPPPSDVFSVVQFPSPVGGLSALLTVDPRDGVRHPAIVWITGGDCNTIGDVWSPQPADNDQTAAAYRRAGIVMMFPSLRGGNQNPGHEEQFYGEVDDIIAAADFLAAQTFVDPKRIYLGGHSSGGTLVLLTAECSERFRAVFSFGPVDDIRNYGKLLGPTPFDIMDSTEFELRSPVYWLESLTSPTFIVEGDYQTANARSVRVLAKAHASSSAHFMVIRGASHFSTLAPMNRLIAEKIIHDDGATTNISISDEEVSKLFPQP